MSAALPSVWSVAGGDSGGGAGLAADQRAAEACGVHLCPVVAALTAQNTVAVTHVEALAPALLEAQLAALADDLPPAVIKTGLLGSADNARLLARWLDRLRQRGPVALVVDPVLRASTGAAFADAALLAAYRDELLPRASVLTPNRGEAARLLGQAEDDAPAQARALRALGAETVCITGGDAHAEPTLALDWLDSPHARGWLGLPRVATRHHHGTGCCFASAAAAALARGFVGAEAALLAKMATTQGLRRALALAGSRGAGPVRPDAGFIGEPTLLPQLWDEEQQPTAWAAATVAPAPGLYAIVDSAGRVQAVLAAGARCVQLRIKQAQPDEALRTAIRDSLAAAAARGATLYINDHWALALELGATALHLGQEDLLRLTPDERARLRAAQAGGVRLGLSSHSLWELARAAAWSPAYIACGPVWPTTTKDMPWQPQGLDNLAWWARMSPAPVVAIGGILAPEQMRQVAAAGARGGCVVRGLGADPRQHWPAFEAAWQAGRQQHGARAPSPPAWPHPALDSSRAAGGR